VVMVTSSNTFSSGTARMSLREYINYTIKENEVDKEVDKEVEEVVEGEVLGGEIQGNKEGGPARSIVSEEEKRRSKRSNESYYLFGSNYGGIWDEMRDIYNLPPCVECKQCGAVTIGIGGRQTGVSFHLHGPGFSEVIEGRKRWFLFPPVSTSYSTSYSTSTSSKGSNRKDGEKGKKGREGEEGRRRVSKDGEKDTKSKENGVERGVERGRERGRGAGLKDIEGRQFDPNMTVHQWVLTEYPNYVPLAPQYALNSYNDVIADLPIDQDVFWKRGREREEEEEGEGEKKGEGGEGEGERKGEGEGERKGERGGEIKGEREEERRGQETDSKARREAGRNTKSTGGRDVGYRDGLQECVLLKGDMLFFPSGWFHATLNLDTYNVFVSLFLDLQLKK
jgi:Cupin-like domain